MATTSKVLLNVLLGRTVGCAANSKIRCKLGIFSIPCANAFNAMVPTPVTRSPKNLFGLMHQINQIRAKSSVAGSGNADCGELQGYLHEQTQGELEESPCWNCGNRDNCEGFFCGCGALQPLQNANYFEILKCPVHFDVDMKYLERNYWALQKQLHPDLYGTRDKIEQDLSAENSSRVNHAYQILKDPVERVKYLLSLYGVEVLKENSSTRDVDAMFLMEVMETREKIDDADSIHTINDLLEGNRIAIETCLKNIKNLFDLKSFDGIAQEAIRLQYFTRINAEANLKLDKLEES